MARLRVTRTGADVTQSLIGGGGEGGKHEDNGKKAASLDDAFLFIDDRRLPDRILIVMNLLRRAYRSSRARISDLPCFSCFFFF